MSRKTSRPPWPPSFIRSCVQDSTSQAEKERGNDSPAPPQDSAHTRKRVCAERWAPP